MLLLTPKHHTMTDNAITMPNNQRRYRSIKSSAMVEHFDCSHETGTVVSSVTNWMDVDSVNP